MADAPRGPKADKIWANALRLAVMRETTDENGRKSNYLTRIAQNMVRKAEDGDVMAMKEIGDRLDGKPAQAIEHSGDMIVHIGSGDAGLL